MATIANLLIGLGVDFGGVTKGLNKGAQGLKSGVQNMRQQFAGMQSVMQRMNDAAGRFKSILSTFGAGAGLSLVADSESAAIAFEVMLGDAQKAAQLVQQIKDFAAATPFESGELRSAAQQLLAFGTEAEQIIPTLRVLGDTASGLGIPLNDLASIYGKARSAGRLYMEDINQLQERGINVTSIWAKQMHKSVAEVRNMVSNGQIGFRDLQEALIELTKNGGAFGGMMERQSATLGGMWSTAVDIGKTALERFWSTLSKVLDFKAALAGLGMAFEAIEKPLTVFAQHLQQTLSGGAADPKGWATFFINALELVSKGIAHVVDAVGWVGIAWNKIVSVFKSGSALIVEALAKVVGGVESAVQAMPEMFGGNPAADFGSESLKQSAADLRLGAEQAQQAVDDALSAPSWVEKIDQLFNNIRNNLAQTKDAANGVADAMKLIDVENTDLDPRVVERWERMEQAARSIFEQTRTPMERYKARLVELIELMQEGFISQDEFMRAHVQAAQELAGSRDTAISAATRGSSEAFTAIRQFRQGRNDPLAELKKQTEILLNNLNGVRDIKKFVNEFARRFEAVEILN